MYTVTIFQDSAGKWRWRMKARNGRIVADSAEGYSSRTGVIKAAERLQDATIILDWDRPAPVVPFHQPATI